MTEVRDLERRIEKLEFDLERYHAHLEEAVEQRDRFGLMATWGILKGLIGLAAWASVLWAAQRFFGDGWFVGLGAGFVGLGAVCLGVWWIERGEAGDQKKLYPLPKWIDRK